MTEWQPIETAPRETEILGCWCKSGVMGVVTCVAGEWEENDESVSSPTHWMPLPEPPVLPMTHRQLLHLSSVYY